MSNEPIYAGDYEYIPDGTYEAAVVRYERAEFFKQKKLYVWFRVVDGPHVDTEIFMPFNLHRKITKGSKYYRAWVVVNKGRKPKKNDRMSPKIFKGKIIEIKTRTVISGRKQKELLKDDRYSVVDEILGLFTG